MASQTAAKAFQRPSEAITERPTKDNKEFLGRHRLTGAFRIEMERIEADPDQPRRIFDETSINELAASIVARNIKQPITVRWQPESQRYRIIDGERRFRAAQRAGLTEVPCIIGDSTGKDILIDQIVANWQRSDLRPYETADALFKLKESFQLSVTELANSTGKSKGEISKLLALVEKVDDEVREMVHDIEEGRITKRHLYALSQLDSNEQRRMANRIQRENLTAIETEKLIRSDSEIQTDKPTRSTGRPRKHVRVATSLGMVTLSPTAPSFDNDSLLKMLHEARRKLSNHSE